MEIIEPLDEWIDVTTFGDILEDKRRYLYSDTGEIKEVPLNMRNKIVKFADKDIDVKEKKIGELEILVRELFPSTKGKLKNLDKALNDLEVDWDLLYKKLPVVFPDITEDDVKNAYMSDLEKLIGAFVDVNFFAIKQMMPKLMLLAQTGSQRK